MPLKTKRAWIACKVDGKSIVVVRRSSSLSGGKHIAFERDHCTTSGVPHPHHSCGTQSPHTQYIGRAELLWFVVLAKL